jgi:hypothetical protein
MSRPTLPRIIKAAMTTMKNWSVLPPSVSSVSIRFLSSTALSSCAVPSVASRSRSALTMPCTKRLARRRAMAAPTTMPSTGRTSWTIARISLHGVLLKSGIAKA